MTVFGYALGLVRVILPNLAFFRIMGLLLWFLLD